jgi:hypothetical protein
LKKIFFWLTVPFSDQEQDPRISAALNIKIEKPITMEEGPIRNPPRTAENAAQVMKSLGQNDSKPGDYVVQVEYLSPLGKVASKPLQFAIRDRGSIYQLLLSGSHEARYH